MTQHFFGYGSLVNRATHSYPDAQAATLKGWRRTWIHTNTHPQSFLSVIRDPDCTIAGLVAHVPNGDWAALDTREIGYARHLDQAALGQTPHPIQVYAVPPKNRAASDPHPILLSYIDVVIQGFLAEYGPQGAVDFFDTTTGWHTPILNDRDAPIYPRAQLLTAEETALVDESLREIGARIIR
ncbi:gamma-glutamylcyclotransferase (plasmid) [Pseudorhodobacter turbinis]|uniref:glutathione-specific gamma-glutamylcyclotransferase n=1 Tax=Pseudorhodobacter turbinis TaxID=2500533 RepID=A0A4P8EIZ3_9RHOB|nr:gamma-glutamylcyclotransferase family protein [Pseudorhodobacter turbinis]QCO56665.1 gamma-glutamylcyclotransferase [Pseudorhodobacter turbinis]